MTSPLRRKRPTTRPNSKAPSLTSGAGGVAVALATFIAQTAPATAELQWRASRDSVVKPPAAVAHDEAVRPVASESPRSVVVSRGGERLAQHDPFEEDAPMPDAAPPAQFDPFDADDASPADDAASAPALTEPEMPAPAVPSDVAEVQEVFDEPQVDDAPSTVEELEAAQEAVDKELMRREVESGADEELVAPTAPGEEQDATETEPEMNDEIVPPNDESLNSDLDMGDEDLDLELQYGADGQLTPEQRRQEMERERIEHEKNCEVLINQVRAASLRDISLDIRLRGEAGLDYPFECEGRHPVFQPRSWAQTTYLWKASGLCHKPLYFEQVQLERYGHDWGPVLQPFVSGAHFFGSVAILPYKMGLETPQECIYELGNYRPGSCAPYMITQPGFTWRAAAFQTGAVTGISAAVP